MKGRLRQSPLGMINNEATGKFEREELPKKRGFGPSSIPISGTSLSTVSGKP